MTTLSLVLAGLAAAVHVLFFAVESILFMREDVFRRFGAANPQEAEVLRPFALNQGFYNLFLAIGCVAGIVLAAGSEVGRDWSMVAFTCLFMVGAAVVLVVSSPRLVRAAALQGLPPALALLLMLLS